MRNRGLSYFLSLLCLVLGTQVALAATPAVSDMAGILMHLEHFPSDAEKAKLKDIIANKATTEQERMLAVAITNLKHAVADADKPKLQKLTSDTSAPAEVRDMAGIILNLDHKPSAADKGKLQQMMK